jgi:nucleotide-binding universal stress UspA family protein
VLDYSKILCALDLDAEALKVFGVAATLARESDATLYALHVARIPTRDMDVPLPFEAEPRWEKEARSYLEDLIHRSTVSGVRYELCVVSGIADIDIVRTATRLKVDLIVMGTHGRGGLRHLILGSVAEHVIREAPCPVLILKPHASSVTG